MALIVWLCLAVLHPVAVRQTRTLAAAAAQHSDPDANAIYSAALIQLLQQHPRHSDCFVLPAKTDSHPGADITSLGIEGDKSFWRTWKGTLLSFVRAGTARQLVDQSAIQSALRTAFRDDRIQVLDSCPGTKDSLFVSSIGFNRGRTRALVWAEHTCGSQCGLGTYFFFAKTRRRWVAASPKGIRGVRVSAF